VTYHEHPSKVVRLDAAGVLVDYAPAQEEDCTVWFAIPDSPDDWEGVLGRRAETDRVEIVGVPIFVYDLSLGDEVQVMKSEEGADVARRVVRASGNVTFRAAFEESARPDHHWRSLMADLSPQECWFDTWSENADCDLCAAGFGSGGCRLPGGA
jgi:hypothetical protein